MIPCTPLLAVLAALCAWVPTPAVAQPGADAERAAFLDELQRRSFLFLWEQADPETGLVADRARADGSNRFDVASIASVGYALAGIPIARERGWVTPDEAYDRVLTTLRFIWNDLPHEHGWYYHFVDIHTGERAWDSELSSIDTALMLVGVLTVRQYYRGTEVEELATKIYRRVDFPWMTGGGHTLTMGWTPEGGFLNATWDGYSEHMMLQLMAIGSRGKPLEARYWDQWRRQPVMTYAGRTYFGDAPLFTHQFSHVWVDFRGRRDAFGDYYRNSVLATEAHRQMCINLADRFPAYGPRLWGITASDTENGYQAWGGPPPTPNIDGTVVPCAAAGSMPFAPEICLDTLWHMKERFGERVWTHYGFADAFNPNTDWTGPDVIGIDVGITLLMIENHRTGRVWDWFMANPEVQDAMRLAGFRRVGPLDGPGAAGGGGEAEADRATLAAVRDAAWAGLDATLSAEAGLASREAGLVLSAIVSAQRAGLIDAEQAEARAADVLEAVEAMTKARGFAVEPDAHGVGRVVAADAGVLAAGLRTAAAGLPGVAERARGLLDAMDWGALYDAQGSGLAAEADATGRPMARPEPGRLATEDRLALVMAIASGAVPAGAWQRLDRRVQASHEARYLGSALGDRALRSQYLPGLWLDEGDTLMGQSAENLAFAQMRRADHEGWRAWGLGDHPDEVVSPATVALAARDYPAEAAANLRVLAELSGVPVPKLVGRRVHPASGRGLDGAQAVEDYAVAVLALSQAGGGGLWEVLAGDGALAAALAEIPDYAEPAYGDHVSVYTLYDLPRDTSTEVVTPDRPRLPDTADRPELAVRNRALGWDAAQWVEMDAASHLEAGRPDAAVAASFAAMWEASGLWLRVKVTDPNPQNPYLAPELHRGDAVEVYLDPGNDGLRWGDPADFQFGYAPPGKAWEWFGQRDTDQISVLPSGKGYDVEAFWTWRTLGITPRPGSAIGLGVAVKDADDRGETKLNWHWRPRGDGYELGRLIMKHDAGAPMP